MKTGLLSFYGRARTGKQKPTKGKKTYGIYGLLAFIQWVIQDYNTAKSVLNCYYCSHDGPKIYKRPLSYV